MTRLLVFTVLIPLTDDATKLAHPQERFNEWMLATADEFGGITQLAANLKGLWFDASQLVQDHSHWYKVAVPADKQDALILHVQKTAKTFGQRCLYFERAGEAEFIFPPGEAAP